MTNKESELYQKNGKKIRLDFPDWTELIHYLTLIFSKNEQYYSNETQARLDYYQREMSKFREEFRKSPLNIMSNFAYGLAETSAEVFQPGPSLEDSINALRNLEFGSNEFFTLFDISQNDYVLVDENIRNILGYAPEQFCLLGMLGLKPDCLKLHREDAMHMARAALIGYMVMCIPGFKWKSLKDFYRARTRIHVFDSNIEELREVGFMTLEKKVYISAESQGNLKFIPTHHMKRWTVYDESEYTGTCPYFGSDPYQSTFRNAYWYLLHAYLLEFPVKFVMLLHERQSKDRYKAIAQSFNTNLGKFNGEAEYMTEGQVADCFAKTIRAKIGDLINTWEMRDNPLVVTSDQEALDYARRLCLLPVPKKVIDLMYGSLS